VAFIDVKLDPTQLTNVKERHDYHNDDRFDDGEKTAALHDLQPSLTRGGRCVTVWLRDRKVAATQDV
jgi:hypothetical protein